jgi:hypothetical protein
MGKTEKLLEKMRNNPNDWRIDDLKVIAKKFIHMIDDLAESYDYD